MNYGAQAYQQSHLLTAPRGDVLLALFDGAIRFVTKAKMAMERRDYSAKAEAVGRATAIIEELTTSLDHTKAPDLCGNLASLYSFYLRQVHRANAELNPGALDHVITQLSHFRETWQAAVLKARQEGHRV